MVVNKCFPLEVTLHILDDKVLLSVDIELSTVAKIFHQVDSLHVVKFHQVQKFYEQCFIKYIFIHLAKL